METNLRRILIAAMLGAVVSCILMRPTAAADNDAPTITLHDKSSTRLYVRTIPPGAKIRLNGQPQDGVSDRLFKVPAGVKRMTIEVELDGHYPRQQEVAIQGGRITRVELQMWEKSADAASDNANTTSPLNPFKEAPDWGTDQATGPPDTPLAGDFKTAWASLTPDAEQEWLMLEYREPIRAKEICVHESYNPGVLSRITALDPDGKEVDVWGLVYKGITVDTRRGYPGVASRLDSGGVLITRFPVKVDFPIRKLKLYLDSPRVPGWNEIDAVGLIDQQGTTHWAAKAEASSTFASRLSDDMLPGFTIDQERQTGQGESLPETPVVKEATIPDNATLVGHVADTSDDKRSIGGTGEAVQFEQPDEADLVVVVSLYASRYGLPQPPEEDFHVYLLDAERRIIKDLTFPHALIKRGPMRWYHLPVPAVVVPEQFHVALSFNAHQTKGVYIGLDKNVAKSHSYTGLPGKGFKPLDGGGEWMIRPYLMPTGNAIPNPR